jgi:medium-chain acyl-[acyl-carrier-protein] hydrolase
MSKLKFETTFRKQENRFMHDGLQTYNQPTDFLKTEAWFAISQPRPNAKLRLFCFPYAGGGSVVFYNWPNFFGPDIEVVAVRLPGRETRFIEKPFTRMAHLISALIPVMRPLMDRPFAFFGHSMGARIAFELTRTLRRQQLPNPIHFFASGHVAPHLPEKDPGLHLLSDQAFIEKIKEYDGIPDMILDNPEILNFFLPMLRADIELIKTHCISEDRPFACPLTAFGGMRDPKVSKEEITAWQMHTRTAFKWHMFPGGHFFIQEHQKELLALILNDLQSDHRF